MIPACVVFKQGETHLTKRVEKHTHTHISKNRLFYLMLGPCFISVGLPARLFTCCCSDLTLIRDCCVLTGNAQFSVIATAKTSAPQHVWCVTNSNRGQWRARSCDRMTQIFGENVSPEQSLQRDKLACSVLSCVVQCSLLRILILC